MAVLTSKRRLRPLSPEDEEEFENKKVYRREVSVEK
jgi:hypothetical protein